MQNDISMFNVCMGLLLISNGKRLNAINNIIKEDLEICTGYKDNCCIKECKYHGSKLLLQIKLDYLINSSKPLYNFNFLIKFDVIIYYFISFLFSYFLYSSPNI